MITYQDFEKIGQDETERAKFVMQAINEHRNSTEFQISEDAWAYYRHENPDINAYEKFVYDMNGIAHKDVFSPNSKIPSNYYAFFIDQAVQYLLANGVSFNNQNIKKKLGNKFDKMCADILTDASNSGVSWGFYHDNKVDHFSFKEFTAFPDEYNGSFKAGVRFFQIDSSKPLRAFLYEIDGVTEYIQENGKEMQLYQPKKRYNRTVRTYDNLPGMSDEIISEENYPGFPIVPMYYINKQSALIGNRNILIAYDMMISKLIDNVSQSDLIYWVLRNYGGMDEVDAAKFISDIVRQHVVNLEGDPNITDATPHTIETPFQASESALSELRKMLFDSFMAYDVERVSAGSVTATEIRSAYQKLDSKADALEYNVGEFVQGILKLAGENEDEKFHFTRSKIVNTSEEITTIIQAAPYIGEEMATKKICEILGMTDEVENIINARKAESLAMFGLNQNTEIEETETARTEVE